ncbi:MAG TPA: glycosyltransferase, partial [Patescibacteria group bacterium]|nr:glycosyltransferase [Patescibacteria group bacterium]
MNQHDQLSLGWVLPRPFAGSGGLNNIFRMVGALQKWGHNSTIYCCDSERTFGSQAALASFIQTNWGLKGVECLFAGNSLKPHDILLATHWSTVSRVKSDPRAVRKAYFVQDFEPLFFAMGDEYIMAENTYSLGLSCITLGHWLENLLRDNYGLDTCGFDFPIDSTIYRRAAGPESRPFDIIYYGQPDKPRRAFHLGCEALRLVKQARPQTNIAMFGSEALAKVQVPFPFRNFGLQTPIELARLYQQSKIALVLSASNPSLVPCEMMACGAAVVDLLRGNNLYDYQPGSIRLAQQNPEALATELLALLEQTEVRQAQITTAESMVTQRSYELSARTVEGALLRLHLTGRVSPAESASLDIRQEFANQQCAVPLEGAAELKSSFVCRMANLTRIDLAILPQSDSVQGELILSLREAGKGEPICRVVRQFSASTGNGFVEFSFPPVPDSAQKTFLISLAFRPKNSAAGSPVILYTDSTDLCHGGALLLAEKSVEGTLRFRTFCRPQLRAPSPLHAAVFDQALRMNGQSGSSKDPAASGLQDICRNIALIERHPAAVSTSEAVRKEKLRSLLKLLNRNGEPSEPATVEALVGGCRKLFREELALAEREEQSNQLLQQAKDEEASGRCKKTEALLKESLRQSTDNEQALLLYGQWLLRQKRTREGFEVLQRLLTLNPRCTAAYNAIGRGMSQKGMVREAHEIFVRAVRCQPQESEGWANLVELHYHSGTRAEGAKILAQWLKLAPADTEAIRWKERYDQPLAPKTASVKGQATDKASKGCISVATLMAEPEEFACPYLRVTSVLKRLEQLGHVRHLRGSRIDDRTLHVNPEQLREADIVLVQRQMAGMLAYPALLQQFKGQMPKIVFDLDDALTVLPKTHRAYQSYARLVPQIEEYLKRADLVTVSTPQLLELYRPFNKNIVVLPNSLDADLWSGPKAGQDPSGRIRILFSGTLDHEQDLRVVEEALLEILAAYPDTVEFLYWGNVTERLRSLPQVRSIHEFTPSYPQYSALLQKLSVSFAIVPLEDTPFNRAKSPIKWLEYSACGIPGIYSDLSPYNQTVEKGMGLVVRNTREAWVAAMKSLVQNQALRQELAGQAQQMVMSRHTIAHNAQRWLQTYELLLGHGGSLA